MAQSVLGESIVCLINRLQPASPWDRITQKEFLTGAEILKVVETVYRIKPREPIMAAVYDGDLVTHAIALEGLDASGRMLYHDGNLGRSLLCAENNAAGVAAEPGPDSLWLISREEMEVVIFAVLLDSNDWLQACGIKE